MGGPAPKLGVIAAALACALFASASPIGAAGMSPDAVSEVLRLAPDWPGGVEMPAGVYRELVRRQQLGLPAELPPVPQFIEEQKHALTLDGDRAALEVAISIRVFAPEAAGRIRLLPASAAFRDITVNGKPEELVPLDVVEPPPDFRNAPAGQAVQAAAPRKLSWLAWKPPEAGLFTITAKASLTPRRDGASRLVSLPRCRAARNVLAVSAKSAWEVASPQSAAKLVGGAGGTRGELALVPGDELAVSWREPLAVAEHEPVISTTCLAACDLAPDAVAVNARLDVLIRRGPTDRLDLELPIGADRITVEGPDVRRVEAQTVHLRGPMMGRTLLSLRFEIPRTAPSGKTTLGFFGVRGATPTGGYLLVSNSAGGELLEEETPGLEAEAFFGLPEDLLALSSEKPVLAYSMKRGRWSFAGDAVLASEVTLPPTIIDTAEHVIVFREGGNAMAKTTLHVRNSSRQFLRVRLPEGAVVRLVRVDEKATAFTPAGPGEILLPLEKSIATVGGLVSFPVEIVTTFRFDGAARRGKLELPLPRFDAPVAYTTCKLYAPEHYRFREWLGPLKPVALLTPERKHAEMAYGRAHTRTTEKEPTTPVAVVAGLLRGRAETPIIVQPPAKPQADVEMLGWNYYRAGLEAYKQKDFAKAQESLEATMKLAPQSDVAGNAAKLLRNVKLALNQPDASEEAAEGKPSGGRLARAQAKQITATIQAGDEALIAEQQEMLKKGQELARQGRATEATELLAGAVVIGEQLGQRGQKGKEQDKIADEAKKELAGQLGARKRLVDVQKKAAELERTVTESRPTARAADSAKDINGDKLRFFSDEEKRAPMGERRRDEEKLKKEEAVVHALKELVETPENEKDVFAQQPPATAQHVSGAQPGKQVILQRARQLKGATAAAPALDDASRLAAEQQKLDALQRDLADLRSQQDQAQGQGQAQGQPGAETQEDAERRKLTEAARYARPEKGYGWDEMRRERVPFIGDIPIVPVLTQPEYSARVVRDARAEMALRPILDELMAFDFVETPLEDVVAFFRAYKRVNIVIDRQAIADRGDLNVTLSTEKMKFTDALTWVCRHLDLAWAVRDDAIFITTKQRLARLAETPPVSHEPEITKDAPEEIRTALDEPVTFDFLAAPLDDVVAFLRGYKKVNIVVDKKATADRGDMDVTLMLERVKFSDALTWICRLVDLAWTVRDGAIFITTPDRVPAPERVITRTYDVSELVVRRDPSGNFEMPDRDEKGRDLLRFVNEALQIKARGEFTGEGRIELGGAKAEYRDGKLIVTHTASAQDQVANLLDNIKRNWEQKVDVRSFNVAVPESVAGANGANWVRGANGLTYALADEGVVRNLVDIGQDVQRWAGFGDNPMVNPAVVGTSTLIANNDAVNVAASTDYGNRFNYNDNDVFVPHNKYLLISNGSYVTVVAGSEMRHWAERVEPKPAVIDVPPRIDLPLVGRLFKFEKTLIEPEDEPVLSAEYEVRE